MPPAAPSAFKIPDFRYLTQARFLFGFAVQIQAVVMGWQMYAIKKDPLYLGLIGLTEAVPALTLALFSGYIVDRSNPLTIYRNVIRLSLLSAGILIAISGDWFALSDDLRAHWIFIAAFVTGVARGFSGPALYAVIPQIVPRSVLSASSAWITSAIQIAQVTGPAAGGIFFAWKGAVLPYAVDFSMLLLALLSMARVQFEPKIGRPPEEEPIFKRLTSGMRYVWSHQLLLSAFALDMFAVLFGGVTALLPLIAQDILKVGPTGLGLLRAAPAVGALTMSAWLIRRPIEHHAGRKLLGSVAGFGFCVIGFGLSKSFGLSLVLLALSGALDSVSMVIRGAIVTLCSPDEMRGRIAAVNSFFIGSSNELGAFESGLAAKLMGPVPSIVFGGCMTLLTVAATARLAPRLRQMDLTRL